MHLYRLINAFANEFAPTIYLSKLAYIEQHVTPDVSRMLTG
jgi:hypothetical protein